jgi:competence protein ComEA
VLRNERASAPLLELLGARLDLNGATAAELQSIPGIGPLLAGRLVAHRNAHGPFRSAEQLRAVAGVGPSMLHRLSRWVTLGKEAAPGASP